MFLATALAALVCLVAGCGSAPRSQAGDGAGTSSGASGVEVFGTIDAGVSTYRTR